MLRVTGGEMCGRRLKVPEVGATRPLVERAREGLMSHLQGLLPGAQIWDVYAGSGILGFEALSRGAEHVVAVELNPKAAQQMARNAELLGLGKRWQLLRLNAFRLLATEGLTAPDLIFFDPPYADFSKGGENRVKVWRLFCDLAAQLQPDGAAVVHTPKGILSDDERAMLPGIVQRDYGSTSLYWWHNFRSGGLNEG
jgi:16S rRNA (guanine966-N2)-methyltransferase